MIDRVWRTRDAFRARRLRFLIRVDEERLADFQAFYYPMLIVAGLYCWLGSDELTRPLVETLGGDTIGRLAAAGFISLHLACPVLTLIGRRLTARTASIPADQPNPGVAGALLQLSGDGGVFGAILIFSACFVNTFYWGQPMYTTFYFLMGIPGGAMFTLRSWRRYRQIVHRGRQIERESDE